MYVSFQVADAVKHAIDVGYRHIDCAQGYGNQAEIGEVFDHVFKSGKVNSLNFLCLFVSYCRFTVVQTDYSFRLDLSHLRLKIEGRVAPSSRFTQCLHNICLLQVARKDLFITSKIWNTFHSFDRALLAIDVILRDLKLEFIDMMLIHWPQGYKEDSDPPVNVPKVTI